MGKGITDLEFIDTLTKGLSENVKEALTGIYNSHLSLLAGDDRTKNEVRPEAQTKTLEDFASILENKS
jgi:hypothetical protein